MDLVEFGRRVRARREKLGMSQKTLAARAGYGSNSTIAHIEAGRNIVALKQILPLCYALETSPNWLLGYEEPEKEEAPDE